MGELNVIAGARTRRRVKRSKKHSLRVDMTPMVDLGFILITFFVMTVQLTQPVAVHLNMPKEGGISTLGESDALTVLLDSDDGIYYYHGDWKKAVKMNQVYATSFSVYEGLGKVIREKQQWLDEHNKKEGRKGLMLLIKPGNNASYKNVIDVLDETMINAVGKYAVLSLEAGEVEWLNKHHL